MLQPRAEKVLRQQLKSHEMDEQLSRELARCRRAKITQRFLSTER
jgi:hypothetical protein